MTFKEQDSDCTVSPRLQNTSDAHKASRWRLRRLSVTKAAAPVSMQQHSWRANAVTSCQNHKHNAQSGTLISCNRNAHSTIQASTTLTEQHGPAHECHTTMPLPTTSDVYTIISCCAQHGDRTVCKGTELEQHNGGIQCGSIHKDTSKTPQHRHIQCKHTLLSTLRVHQNAREVSRLNRSLREAQSLQTVSCVSWIKLNSSNAHR